MGLHNQEQIVQQQSSHTNPKLRDRQNTSQSLHSKQSKKIEVHIMESGLPIILNEGLLKTVQSSRSGQAIEAIKDHMTRYFKSQDIFHRLRPIDLHVLCEYCYIIIQFTETITLKESPQVPIIANILLDIFFNENPKYMKIKANFPDMKQADKDLLKLTKWLRLHQPSFNSHQVLKIINWADKDYLTHFQLFHFQAAKDDSALDITYNLIVDQPTFIPLLKEANFIPQAIASQSDVDTEEEEEFAFRRSYIEKKKTIKLQQEQQVQSQIQSQEQTQSLEQSNKLQEYIDKKFSEVESHIEATILSPVKVNKEHDVGKKSKK